MLKPKRLESGDTIGVIAPSRSLSIIDQQWIENAERFFGERGISVKFSENCMQKLHDTGGSVGQRVSDLMGMFNDDTVDAIITAIGGYNSNQLLEHLDFDVIRRNPKIFLGYSDITALSNAIHAKTGLVTFSGPHFSTLGQPFPMDYTVKYFEEVLMQGKADVQIEESDNFAEDAWYQELNNPKPRQIEPNLGWSVIREGAGAGQLIGGNVVTLQALLGTDYMPSVDSKVLFLEDCTEDGAAEIDRALTHMRYMGVFEKLSGLLIGRFPSNVGFDNERLRELLLRITGNTTYPIITNMDFGHTEPMATLPLGIPCAIHTTKKRLQLLTSAVQ